MMCLCGKPYDAMCRFEAFGQLTGNVRYLDTSLLTNDVKKNRAIAADPKNYHSGFIKHGPVSEEFYSKPSPPSPSHPELYNTYQIATAPPVFNNETF